MAFPGPLCRRLARTVGHGGPLPLERWSSRARARLSGRRFVLPHSGSGDHRVREDGVAPPLQRRKLQSFRARMDAGASAEFPRRRLRQQPCAQAAPSCPRGACGGSMLLGASKQGNAIFCAMTTPVYCDGPEKESTALAMSGGQQKQRCPSQLCRAQRASSAILISEACCSRA